MMRAGFDLLDAHALDPLTYPSLKTIFNLCTMPQTKEDVLNISYAMNSALVSMAMVNYPYPTDFLAPLPTWPVDYACS